MLDCKLFRGGLQKNGEQPKLRDGA
jgi:hypothetical protein